MPNREKILQYLWLIILTALFIISILLVKNGTLVNQIGSFGIFAPIIFVLLKISTLVIAPLSGAPLYIIAGSLFGNTYGLLLSILGDALGTIICFLLSKYYGENVVRFLAGNDLFAKIKKTAGVLNNHKSFLKARVTFFLMPEVLSYASGFSQINFFTFTLINFLFYLPIEIGYLFFGSELIAFLSKYTLLTYGIIFIIAISGFGLLYKDYKKIDNIEGL
jgi:uncharacterized membrane protein YdjX (TVP38/TMEM64 family)